MLGVFTPPPLIKTWVALVYNPIEGEDMCGYLGGRQDRPVLTKIKQTPASVRRKIAEIRRNWKLGAGGTIVRTMSTGITPNIALLKCMS